MGILSPSSPIRYIILGEGGTWFWGFFYVSFDFLKQIISIVSDKSFDTIWMFVFLFPLSYQDDTVIQFYLVLSTECYTVFANFFSLNTSFLIFITIIAFENSVLPLKWLLMFLTRLKKWKSDCFFESSGSLSIFFCLSENFLFFHYNVRA